MVSECHGVMSTVMIPLRGGCTCTVPDRKITYLWSGSFTKNATEKDGGETMVDIGVQKFLPMFLTYNTLSFGTTKEFMCKSESYGKSGLSEKISL